MLNIVFSAKKGYSCQDSEAFKFAKEKFDKKTDGVIYIGTELIITCFRVLIAENPERSNDFAFYFENKEGQGVLIPHNQYGELDYYPKEMTIKMDLLSRLMNAKKIKKGA